MVGDHIGAAYSGNSDTSLLAYEKLIDGIGGDDEWSQMSIVKKMMEKEDESEAVNVIFSHFAKSPGRCSTSLSNFLGDYHADVTDLSLLNETGSSELEGSAKQRFWSKHQSPCDRKFL